MTTTAASTFDYTDVPSDPDELRAGIDRLRQERNAVILAHYYQEGAIQDVADYVGDSLGLSQRAAETDADVIAFAGVHFMAETAKILNPGKVVVVPDLDAGCSLDESAPADEFRAWVEAHPGATVISYINCSAAVKSLSDIICTSSNAEKVVNSVPEGTPILFAPDEHLGSWLKRRTGRDMTLWPGRCMVHDAFAVEQLERLMDQFPEAEVISHPECPPDILELSGFVGSTTNLMKRVASDPSRPYILATESGLLHEIRRRVPEAQVIPLPPSRSNVLGASTEASIPMSGQRPDGAQVLDIDPEHGCACAICPHMRKNTMQKLYLCLRDLKPSLELDPAIAERALLPIQRMLEISA
jgi:quinolinate synthase